ncbi:EAL domain-containing protein [Thioalkalivibrio sp.]|uniref:EAL domain-containing response regulator n=1 Tax=Thioalkalivibrio sp. TaxID=2093813 RepID=UPI0039753271
MAQNRESISILFVTRDPELAERLISAIRVTGQAVRAAQARDASEVGEEMLSRRFHAVVLVDSDIATGMREITDAMQNSGRVAPIVVMTDRGEAERMADYEAGAFASIDIRLEELAAILILKAVEFSHCRTQLHHLHSSLQAAERRYLRLLESSLEPAIYIQDGHCVSVNDAWREYFQIDATEDLAGLALTDFVAPEQRGIVERMIEEVGEQADAKEIRRLVRLRTLHGRSFDADLVITDATANAERCTVARVAVGTEPPGAGQLSALDAVTGLHNRGYLLQTLEATLATVARAELPFALIVTAVDDFERIHDELGFSGSDILLSEIALLLKEHFTPPATVARLSDEEFGIVLPGVRRPELDRRLAALVRAAAHREINLGQGSTRVSISCAAVITDESAPTIEGLLTQVHRALDEVRQAGGNGHRFQNLVSDTKARAESDQRWKQRIEAAMAQRRLTLLYQPVVNLHGGDTSRFNVFVRLSGPDGEIYEPSDFLPAAERTGMTAAIDRWIIRHAIEALAERRKQDPRTTFFLKLTRGSLIDGSVVVWLQEFLHKQRVPAANVVVSINEAVIITNLKAAISTTRGLKAMHASLCIDDFGNGLNPFHILRYVDADYIKLDGTFVRDVVSNESSQRAIRDFTEGGHAKGKQIIVPMVEDAATLAVLYSLNVNLVQGYFVHPPGEQMDFDFTQAL